MKNHLIILCLLLILASCSKNNNNNPDNVYKDAHGTYINFITAKWIATKNGNFVNVSLNMIGNTNADKITIRTAGDGVADDYEVPLKDNNFNQEVGIYFTAAGASLDTINNASTQIFAYKGKDTLKVTLTSGKLTF